MFHIYWKPLLLFRLQTSSNSLLLKGLTENWKSLLLNQCTAVTVGLNDYVVGTAWEQSFPAQ